MFGPSPKVDRAQPLYMQADQLVYDTKNNRVIAQGNVEVYYNNYILTADQVVYDQNLNKVTAEGNAQLKDPNGSITRADKLEAVDDFRDAFVQSLSMVTRDDTRIAAERAIRRDGNVTEFQRGRFTPCRNEAGMPPLWCLSAARIVHDQQAATITYQDAQFELFGVPVIYLPYFQHPDPSVKRQSGFLTPSYSHSTTLGASARDPLLFRAGAQLRLHVPTSRYFSDHRRAVAGRLAPPARQRPVHRQVCGDRRRVGPGHQRQRLARIDPDQGPVQSLSIWWRYGWDITVESDESFRRFYQLDPILQTDRVNVAYLQGISERNYFSANFYHFGGLLLTDFGACQFSLCIRSSTTTTSWARRSSAAS